MSSAIIDGVFVMMLHFDADRSLTFSCKILKFGEANSVDKVKQFIYDYFGSTFM